MLDRGEITDEEAKHHPIKNYITRALGVKDRITVDFTSESFGEKDVLLMCSDGLSNMIEADSLKEMISVISEETCEKLVDVANKNGGRDNITAVIASY